MENKTKELNYYIKNEYYDEYYNVYMVIDYIYKILWLNDKKAIKEYYETYYDLLYIIDSMTEDKLKLSNKRICIVDSSIYNNVKDNISILQDKLENKKYLNKKDIDILYKSISIFRNLK